MQQKERQEQNNPNAEVSATPLKLAAYTASFEIYTNGTKRIFTDKKYHKQSEEVFINLPDPSIINIAKQGITWGDFFKTLPMKLDEECLTTGTGQLFCTNSDKTLKFYLNSDNTPNALEKIIEPDSKLIVKYE